MTAEFRLRSLCMHITMSILASPLVPTSAVLTTQTAHFFKRYNRTVEDLLRSNTF